MLISTAPNTAKTISCKAWNSPEEYSSRGGGGGGHSGRCVVAEREQRRSRKPKCTGQNEWEMNVRLIYKENIICASSMCGSHSTETSNYR